MSDAEREKQARRLYQYVVWNVPANLLMPPVLALIAWNWNRPILYAIAVSIFRKRELATYSGN